MSARERVLVLFAAVGLVRVMVCPLCAALVVVDGRAQHARHHAAGGAR